MKKIVYILLVNFLFNVDLSHGMDNTTPNKIDLGLQKSLDSNNMFGGFIGYKEHFSNNFVLGFESSVFTKQNSRKLNTNIATKIGYSLHNRLIPYVILGVGNEFFKSDESLSQEKYTKVHNRLSKESTLISNYNVQLAKETTKEIYTEVINTRVMGKNGDKDAREILHKKYLEIQSKFDKEEDSLRRINKALFIGAGLEIVLFKNNSVTFEWKYTIYQPHRFVYNFKKTFTPRFSSVLLKLNHKIYY